MHVDAFFEYLLGKRHTYFIDLPAASLDSPLPERDGVPVEEDLAIRALDPSFRPKRGRKRAESPEDEAVPPKRSLLTTSFVYEGQTLYAEPQSAHPASSIPLRAAQDQWPTPDGMMGRSMAPHSAISARPPQNSQWRLSATHEHPLKPYPMSAIEPRTAEAMFAEPQSASPPSARARKRRGPNVSSAWPGSDGSRSAKPRGRPPADRVARDGHFTTFAADPTRDRLLASKRAASRTSLTPVDGEMSSTSPPNAYSSSGAPQESSRQLTNGRPERLQVLVPQHTGRPVRLATPTLLLNGESSSMTDHDDGRERHFNGWDDTPVERTSSARGDDHAQHAARSTVAAPRDDSAPGFAYEALKRILARDLCRGSLSGRRQRLLPSEASRLADAILRRLEVPLADSESKSDDAIRMAAASWLGVSSQLGFSGGRPCKEKEIAVRRVAVTSSGSHVPMEPNQNSDNVKELFDVSWGLGFGGVGGRFAVVGLELEPEPMEEEDAERQAVEIISSVAGQPPSEVDWKSKFMALDLTTRLMKGQLNRLQDKVLDALL